VYTAERTIIGHSPRPPGGTMLLPGTHRLVDRYREGPPALAGAGKENWLPFMRHHPWLARLLDGANLPDHGRPLVGAAGEIDGVPVQVVELTGSPGNVVVTTCTSSTPARPILVLFPG
jgi:hypothetical protein